MKVLVYDLGLFIENAVRLARDGHEVYYFVPWIDAFPKSTKALIGAGFEGIKRVRYFWDYVDQVDVIVFFDTHCQDMVEYLRGKGYKVWGAGRAEQLELDRWYGRQVQKQVGLPTQFTRRIKGLTNLREFLQNTEDKWVKQNIFRGDLETWHHINYKASQPLLDHLAYELGAKQDQVEFIVENGIEGIEPGYDGFVIDGQYPSITQWGFELKGNGYIGKVEPYRDIPKCLQEVNDKLAPVFQQYKARTFFSTELKLTKEGVGYLIDPTVRSAAPIPTPIQIEIFENYSDIILKGAEGILVEPKPIAKYGIGLCLESEWAQNHWLEVEFPPELRQWVKFRTACRFNGKYYALPGFTSIVSVIATGNDIKQIAKTVEERTSKIDAYLLDKDVNTAKLQETLEEIKQYGINF